MSVFTFTLTVEHEGQSIPLLPLTFRLEDNTGESKWIDQVLPATTHSLQGSGQATAPVVALHFERKAQCSPSSNSFFHYIDLGPDSIFFSVGNTGVTVFPVVEGHVQGIL